MKYARHRSGMKSKKESSKRRIGFMPIIIGVLLVIILVLGFQLNKVINTLGDGDEDVLMQEGEDGTDEAGQVVTQPVTDEDIEEASTTSPSEDARFEEIEVYYEGTKLVAGLARRQVKHDEFTHVIVVDLPAINPEVHYYEAWLVQPGITDYFSTGSLFAREDGKFALVYKVPMSQAPSDIFTYSNLVITRELYDGNEWPSPAHMAEGFFSKESE